MTTVWDHEFARADKWSTETGARNVNDVRAIWNDDTIDAVIICSETDRHQPLVEAAAAAKKHMFVEKPLGFGSADANAMATAIEQAGVLFQTGYFQRGNPIHLFLRQEIQAGHFGKLTAMRHSNCHAGSLGGWFDTDWRWMADLDQAGVGGFGDLGTHSLDILMWLLGDVAQVTATVGVATGRYGDCDEYGEGLLEFRNGTIATLAAGWVDVAHPVNVIVSGTEGHAYACNNELFYKSSHVAGADGANPWTNLPQEWPHAFELFLDALVGKPDVPLVSPREAAARSVVMEALYEGANGKRWVAIPE
ncbi:MAG: Gfo/Idh/MocA family oxidoreductase [Caldilineaceae bacterium]